jgi:uncharacterized membrane protein YwzB
LAAIAENDPARGFMGAALTSTCLSWALTAVQSDLRLKHFAEVALLIASIVAVAVGYMLTGSALLMVFIAMVLSLVLLAVFLSYLLPKFRSSSR